VIPTVAADSKLAECLRSLESQTHRDRDIVVVDNSGEGRVLRGGAPPGGVRVMEAGRNLGFGGAINAAVRESRAPFLATLNDDAVADPRWLAALVSAMRRQPDVGMCASQVRLYGEEQLDSAGMLVARDGSSRQRGHLRPPWMFPAPEEALLPSGSAALYRRAMLDEVGLFDDDFFLYCEDTDLGLRARLAGWSCRYVPQAVVEHDYSVSSGRASRLKAFYVERNRLWTVAKTFPLALWPLVPFYSLWRYLLHFWALLTGRGLAAEFTREGEKWWRLVLIVGSAHVHALSHLPALLAKRKRVRSSATLGDWAFWKLIRRHYARASQIAMQ
jgi:GT2 family glycosyltransferase